MNAIPPDEIRRPVVIYFDIADAVQRLDPAINDPVPDYVFSNGRTFYPTGHHR